MIYRLDYSDGHDRPADPVGDPLFVGHDLITRHARTARAKAVEAAAASGRTVLVSRIDGAGRVRVSMIVDPDGTARRRPA